MPDLQIRHKIYAGLMMTQQRRKLLLGLLVMASATPALPAYATVLTLDANGNYVDTQPVQSGETPYALPAPSAAPEIIQSINDKAPASADEDGAPFPDPNGAVATDPDRMKNPYTNYEIILKETKALSGEPEQTLTENAGRQTYAPPASALSEAVSLDVLEAELLTADDTVIQPAATPEGPQGEMVFAAIVVDPETPAASTDLGEGTSAPIVLQTMPSMQMVTLTDPASQTEIDLALNEDGVSYSEPTEFDALIRAEVAKYDNVDMAFVKAVISTESNYNTTAVSPKGAMGLMQIMPDTATTYNVINPFSPEQNIRAGTAELSRLMTVYRNPTLALAGYNAGQGAVEEYNGVPPYSETQNYIVRVLTKTFEARERQMTQVAKKTTDAEREAQEKAADPLSRPLMVQTFDW